MSSRKSDPENQAETIRVHKHIARQLRTAHPKYIAKTRSIINFADFTDFVIAAGLKILFKN